MELSTLSILIFYGYLLLYQLAHHEEKRLLLEQTLLTTKDQLKQRVTDNVKQEQTIARLQTDMSATQEQNLQLEQEYGEVKQLLDQ